MSTDAEQPWSVLARGTGVWEGEESMAPAPWAPDGMETAGRTAARLVLGGRGLASDYRQTAGDAVTLTGHTLIRWNEDAEAFRMHFFSEPGGGAMVMEGRATPDGLVFEGDGPGGRMRQSFRYGPETMEVTSEAPDGEGGWRPVFEARYRKVADADEGAPTHPTPVLGGIAWTDLTVEDAPALRDFYAAVCGWEPDEVSMGEYADYNMLRPDGVPAAGVCLARGSNADLPPAWLVYVVVDDVERALAEAEGRGGGRVTPVRTMGEDRMAVLRDPAGAVLAVYERGGG